MPITGAPFCIAISMNLANLLRMGFGERAAEHGEILTEHIDEAAVDRAPACDHTIACGLLVLHAEIGAAVGYEHVEFFERPFVQQQIDPFTGSELATGVLRIDALLPPAKAGFFATVFELF